MRQQYKRITLNSGDMIHTNSNEAHIVGMRKTEDTNITVE